jgi:HEPN domain-containing protein
MREEARNWIKQGWEEMGAAQDLLKSGRFFGVAFYAHQAVEKFLKGAIVETKRVLAPRGHNLLELARELGVPEGIWRALQLLNPEYTVSRYPDAANGIPAENYNREKAETLLKAADEVISWVRAKIGEDA